MVVGIAVVQNGGADVTGAATPHGVVKENSMTRQLTISIVTATEAEPNVGVERVYLVGRAGGTRYVAPEVFATEHEADIALELGMTTPSFMWAEWVGTALPDGARPKR
jgi:hypothetical protein